MEKTEDKARYKLDPQRVFGAESTYNYNHLSKLLGAPGTDSGIPPKGWEKMIDVEGFEDIEELPKICDPAGTVYLSFDESGRVDRFEVIGNRKVKVFYSRVYVSEADFADLSFSVGSCWQISIHGLSGEVNGFRGSIEKVMRLLRCLPHPDSES